MGKNLWAIGLTDGRVFVFHGWDLQWWAPLAFTFPIQAITFLGEKKIAVGVEDKVVIIDVSIFGESRAFANVREVYKRDHGQVCSTNECRNGGQ